ncbi:hypothetical protein [Photobacterium sp. J15]|uniref:hypothetical protein n=1 Tax=Photobacterium sp. J15 TaxID=265901 RepID=UPI0007E4CF0F|nr:hypothetical protein [Photobacterium sp. J15]
MMNSDVHNNKASDFQLLNLASCDMKNLASLFNENKANQQQDVTRYLVFKQQAPHFYSLRKHRIDVKAFEGVTDGEHISINSPMTDSAVEEIDVDFPLARYRAVNRHTIFNLLLALKEQHEYHTLNIRLPLWGIASENELKDIVKLCLVAGADNLVVPFDTDSEKQHQSYSSLVLVLIKRLFVTESCGIIYSGLTSLPAMERIVALSQDELGDKWVEGTFLKFEC